MLFLVLQTFAWMLLAGTIGASLGYLARRTFAPIEATAGVPAAVRPAAMPVTVAARGPVVEASRAPAATPMPASTLPVPAPYPPVMVSVAPATPYDYPVTTIGIPRSAPDLVQPQIQRVELTAPTATVAPLAAAAATAATVKIVTPSVEAVYPVTTVGIPSGQLLPTTAAAVAPDVVQPDWVQPDGVQPDGVQPDGVQPDGAKPDPGRFDKALAGQVAVAQQPRPEPLRPELTRAGTGAPATVTPAAVTPAAVTPAAVPAAAVVPPVVVPPVVVAKTVAPAAPAAPVVAAAPVAPLAAVAPVAQVMAAPAAVAQAAVATAAAAAAAAASTASSVLAQATPAAPVVASAADVKPAPATLPASAAVVKPVAAAASGDDFTRIRAIDPDLQRRLNGLGYSSFGDLAKMSAADIGRVSQSLGLLGRVEQENWVEQAQILASGGDTYYSRRRQRGEIPAAEGNWAAADASEAVQVKVEPAQVSSSQATPSQATPSQASTGGAAAAAAAAAMAAAGAAATTAAANAAEPAKPAKLADAIKSNIEPERRSDLTGLRSVRSEALRPDLAAGEGQRSGQPRPTSQIDDLKRVRGVGVLIEKKLNSLGVTTYEQIANWTNADIDRVSQILDFKGRIERENWVEQARILASGGNTEFSRRVDRGEA